MDKLSLLIFIFSLIIIFQEKSIALANYSIVSIENEVSTQKGCSVKVLKKQGKKQWKKKLKAFLINNFKHIGVEGEKKKMPFGVLALLALGGGFLGLLFGSGIGSFTIFLGWLVSVIFSIRGLKNDKNKVPAIIALAAAGLLLLSTITFLNFDIF